MARQERPVDPAAGPLESFAYDLRKLRLEAGQPTYRSLARTAGYSASTLSEAANGVRRPSLDVLLAYVGACGGDTATWRDRWLALDEELRPDDASADNQPAENASGGGQLAENISGNDPLAGRQTAGEDVLSIEKPVGEPAPTGPSGSPTGAERRWWSRPKIGIVAATGVALVGIAVAAIGYQPKKESAPDPVADARCPTVSDAAVFTATTYGSGVHVRRGPALDEPITHTIPAGCVVGLTGFCLGEKVGDTTAGTPDVRWFRVDDGSGVIASAVVHGNPTADLRPSQCDNGRPWPASVTLTVAADPATAGTLNLSADGTHVDIVGFAVFHAPDPDLPDVRKWRQIRLTGSGTPKFDIAWNFARIRNPPKPTEKILVAAVACLGGNGPTDVLDVREVRTDGFSRTATTLLGAAERAAATRSACRYPVAD